MRNLYCFLALLLLSSQAWSYSLVNSNATAQAVSMYSRLAGYIGTGKTAIGQHVHDADGTTYRTPNWYEVSGSYPMFMEWNYPENGSYMPEYYSNAMKTHYNAGGIIGVFWQMNNWSSIHTGDGSATDESGNTVVRILPGGADRSTYLSKLDKFATWCKTTMAGYPIVFRPYHETDINSFWWGYNVTSDANYVALWQDMYNYLTTTDGVNNLIWVYSPEILNGYTVYKGARFPGSSYVDIYSCHRYNNSGSYSSDITGCFDVASSAAVADGKPYAITEGYQDQGNAYSSTYWTSFISAVEADASAKQAVYWMFWTSTSDGGTSSYGPVQGRGDSANFNSMLNANTNLLTLAPYSYGANAVISSGANLKGRANLK